MGMKMPPLLLLALFVVLTTVAAVLVATNWHVVRADYELARSDWAISRAKSWRMRLETTDSKFPKEWMDSKRPGGVNECNGDISTVAVSVNGLRFICLVL